MINFIQLANRLSLLAELDPKTIAWRLQFVKKRPANVKPLLPGTKIFYVDGSMLRSMVDSDVVQGANWMRYPWMPKYEIWIDDSMPASEFFDVLLHESVESYFMWKHHLTYDQAHDKAKAVEDKLRHSLIPKYELSPDAEKTHPAYGQ